MSEALDKKSVQEALRKAAQAGTDTLREFDKVWAAINRGEYDVEPEVVVHARAVLDHAEEHDAATVFAADYILARHEGRPAPYVGQLPGAEKAGLEQAGDELAAIKVMGQATQAFIDGVYGPGQYLVVDWANAIHVRYLQAEQEDSWAGLPEMVTYATEPSGSIVAEIGALQTVHERLVRIAANGSHLAKGK